MQAKLFTVPRKHGMDTARTVIAVVKDCQVRVIEVISDEDAILWTAHPEFIVLQDGGRRTKLLLRGLRRLQVKNHRIIAIIKEDYDEAL
jgi:hypothetical protein